MHTIMPALDIAHCVLGYVHTVYNIAVSTWYYTGVTSFLQLYHHHCSGVHTFSPPMRLQDKILLF